MHPGEISDQPEQRVFPGARVSQRLHQPDQPGLLPLPGHRLCPAGRPELQHGDRGEVRDRLPGQAGDGLQPDGGGDSVPGRCEEPVPARHGEQMRDQVSPQSYYLVAEWLEWLSLHTRVLGSILGRGTM